jgi:hypothetical protein
MALLVSLPIALGPGVTVAAHAGEPASAEQAAASRPNASAKAAPMTASDRRAAEQSCVMMKDRESEAAGKSASEGKPGAANAPKHRKRKTNRQHKEECRKSSHM